MTMELKAIDFSGRYFPPGEVIADRFTLQEQLGEGPFGQVYRADDNLIEASVAIKIFSGDLLTIPLEEEHFLKATRRARALTQKNVVRLHDSGLHKGHPWVSMQALEGLHLRKVVRMRHDRGESFSVEEMEPILAEITLALQHVARDYPHGNLKPENVLFLPDLLKITDSYLYDALPSAAFAKGNAESPFVAPELLVPGGEGDQRCDVYSVGALIGLMLFGEDYEPGAYNGDDASLTAIDALCRRAMAFDPSERYRSVERLNEDFTSIVDTGVLLTDSQRMRGISAAGISAPSSPEMAPPPAPGPPPAPAPAAPVDPLDVETSPDIATPLQEDLTTREFTRDGEPELGDLLPTNEVDRSVFPAPPAPPPEEKPAAPAKTTGTPAKKPSEKKEGPSALIILGIVGMVVMAVIVGLLTRDSPVPPTAPMTPEVAEEAAVAEIDEADEDRADEDEEADQNWAAALSGAWDEVRAALDAAEESAQARAEELAEEADDAEEAEEVAEERDEPPTVAAAGGRTAERESPTGAARPPRGASEPEAAPAAGTDCPSGMVLVRRSAGNVCVDAYEYPGRGRTPEVRVSWFDASRLCEQQGKRLCTLSEWRSACGTHYPYGSTFDAERCNTADEDGFERSLAAAGSFPGCRSPSGAFDMSGNVHEWVEERRVAGGGYDSDEDLASCRYSSPKAPGSRDPNVGFRCCADPS